MLKVWYISTSAMRSLAYLHLVSTHIDRHAQIVLSGHHPVGIQEPANANLPYHITSTFDSCGRHRVHRSPGFRDHMFFKLCIAVGILRNCVRAYTSSIRCTKKSLWLWSVEAAPATKHTQTSACAPRSFGETCDMIPMRW
jgi:hypothetical protein